MAWMRLRLDEGFYRTDLQKELLEAMASDTVHRNVNLIIADAIEDYVPLESGALRDSVRVGPTQIEYTTEYARYQYYGEVYGPNYWVPLTRNADGTWNRSGPYGWRSPRGKKKYPTGRPLTYHTSGTYAFWYEVAMSQNRRSINQQITRYLKDTMLGRSK